MGARAPTPAQGFLCERNPCPTALCSRKAHLRGAELLAAQSKSVRSALADCAPSKLPLCLGGVILKSGLLAAPRGHPRQRKNLSLEVGKPLRKIFRAHPLRRCGGPGSPRRAFVPFSRQKGTTGVWGRAAPLVFTGRVGAQGPASTKESPS